MVDAKAPILGYILGLWIDYGLIYWLIYCCHGDQLSPFSQLISRSCDHHFKHLFGKSLSLLSMIEQIPSCRCLKGVVIEAL